jgi:hypothetical protein
MVLSVGLMSLYLRRSRETVDAHSRRQPPMEILRHHRVMQSRLRTICLVMTCVLAAQAQSGMNLDQLKQMISSSLALKYDDKHTKA